MTYADMLDCANGWHDNDGRDTCTRCGADLQEGPAEPAPVHVFTCEGYDFHRFADGRWNVAHRGDPAPANGAYATPEPIAKLKGCDLRRIEWTPPQVTA